MGAYRVRIAALDTGPEASGRYECGTPIATDVCGGHQILVKDTVFEYFC